MKDKIDFYYDIGSTTLLLVFWSTECSELESYFPIQEHSHSINLLLRSPYSRAHLAIGRVN